MNSNRGVFIDDQYSLTKNNPNEQRDKNVHFFDKGEERQAQQVAELIFKILQYFKTVL